jgi:p-hydroxybenzoate 3-monooxygenase
VRVSVGIVGAGPAGLFAATVLARAGIDTVVVERLEETAVRARARAGLIEERTARLLDRHGLAVGMHQRGKTLGSCEFRRHGHSYVYDYGSLCGATHRVYPQQLLVADLIDALREAGGQIRFATQATAIHVRDRPVIELAAGPALVCDLVLGCDGFHGVSRTAAAAFRYSGVDFGAEWLSILADAPPSSPHQLYGLHPDGFAGHMHRTATVSRFYLQVPPGTRPDVDDEAIWATLDTRLAVAGQPLHHGPITEKSILQLRSGVTQPLQCGPLYLAGDAAHIVTPAGGKGMNLALQDAGELVEGVIGFLHRGERDRLDAYSATRLPRIWQSVEFSHQMLQLLLARDPGTPQGDFHEGLRDAQLARLIHDDAFTRAFARTYVGLDALVTSGQT